MGILKLFKKKTNNPEFNESSFSSNNPNALYSKCVYNTKDNTIVLIRYGDNILPQAISFVKACYDSELIVKFLTKDIDNIKEEEIDESIERKKIDDKDITPIEPEKISKQIYYIILSGTYDKYRQIYDNIDNLDNDILTNLYDYIFTKYFCSAYFKKYIDAGIISAGDFKYTNTEPVWNDRIDGVEYISIIKGKLPSGLNERDFLDLITFVDNPSYNYLGPIRLKQYANLDSAEDTDKLLADKIKLIIKQDPKFISVHTIDHIRHLYNTPTYMLEDTDYMFGDMSEEDIAEEFRVHTDSFTGLVDEAQEYISIDEVIEDSNEPDDDYVRDAINNTIKNGE